MHCDKHVVKMIVEYAQLLSTAHRVLDGTETIVTDAQDRVKPRKFLLLEGESVYVTEQAVPGDDENEPFTMYRWAIKNALAYNATHSNHPSAAWARETSANYNWLVALLDELLAEYTFRYGKVHATADQLPFLRKLPRNIKRAALTTFPQAMPPQYQVPDDSVAAYQNFYLGSKIRFAKWTTREVPKFFTTALAKQGIDAAHFHRTR